MRKIPPFIKLFDFELYNIEEFVYTDFRKINPRLNAAEHRSYWEDHLEKLMIGKWGRDYDKKKDKGGYRYMTNDLYSFVNFFHMHLEEGSQSSLLSRPTLRDLDWWITYNFAEAEGFSGFADDKEFTCHRYAKEHKSYKDLMKYEKILLDRYADNILDKHGKFKKYVRAHEYLQQTFKEPLGRPLYQNENENLLWFASRRVGKSYHMVNKMQRGFMTNNATTLEEYYRKDTKFVGIFGSWAETYTKEHLSKFFASYNKVSTFGEYKEDGIEEEGALWFPTTGSEELGKYITNLNKEKGGKGDVGWGSQIHRFSFQKSKSAGVGVGSNFMVGDEVGTWDNLEGVNAEMDPTQRRETKFASIFYPGTGGNITKALKSKKAFYNPGRIGAVKFKDYCNPKNERGVGMFTPVQYTKNIYRNENGNIDLRASYEDEVKIRQEKYEVSLKTYIDHVAAYCMEHDDVFMQESSSVLPIDRAADKLGRISNVPIRERKTTYSIGRLSRPNASSKSVSFVEDVHVEPITDYEMIKDATKAQKNGVVIMYEPPKPDSTYITTYDAVRDYSGTSMCIAVTWKISGPDGVRINVAAESIFRSVFPKENDEVAICMSLYYGCKMLPETNVPSIITTCVEYGIYSLLEKTPNKAISTLLKQNEKYEVGVYISPGMKEDIPNVSAELLMTKVDSTVLNEETNEISEVWMVDEIESDFLLNDIISWESEGNYDYISNLFIFALYIKELKLNKALNAPKEGNSIYMDLMKQLQEGSVTDDTVFDY